MSSFPVDTIRKDFPILGVKVRKSPLVYLDNAATTQHPQSVIDCISDLYANRYASVHRGVHYLSDRMTAAYEDARTTVAEFLGTSDNSEVIFTRGTTESINLLAYGWGRKFLGPGDVVAVTRLEHHANFVTWQTVAQQTGAKFAIVEIDSEGNLQADSLESVLAQKPKVFAFTLMSNVLGNILPVEKLAQQAKAVGALVFVDAAQGIGKVELSLKDIPSVDFLAFSGHKVCGPTGIGVLWGRKAQLEAMDPYNYGGAMIEEVGDANTTWTKVPWKFEAGTPNIVGTIGLAEALRYIQNIGRKEIAAWEEHLLQLALPRLKDIPDLVLYGPQSAEDRGGVISFGIEGLHPHDIGSFLDTKGIAIRVGHHCAQPLMRSLGVEGTARASFYFYNTEAEVDFFVSAVKEARDVFLG